MNNSPGSTTSSSTTSSSHLNRQAVVAQLSQQRVKPQPSASSHQHAPHTHPYSSVCLSPCRSYAITAGKDFLQVVRLHPGGLQLVKTVPASIYFQPPTPSVIRNNKNDLNNRLNLSEFAFGGGPNHSGAATASAQQSANTMMTNIVITDVAWSHGITDEDHPQYGKTHDDNTISSSLIAAAGSNGVIVVWSAATLLEGVTSSNTVPATNSSVAPEAVLTQHVRAVNRLKWHPALYGLLLSASQDSTVLLWERRQNFVDEKITTTSEPIAPIFKGFFGLSNATGYGASQQQRSSSHVQWLCSRTFTPKSEAVRDVAWSPYFQDVFAVVTGGGSLLIYNRRFHNCLCKLTAHSGDATCLDWHPIWPYILATGGASDRSVKIWDMESDLSLKADEKYLERNTNTASSRGESTGSNGSSAGPESQHGNTISGGTITMVPINSRTMSSSSSATHLNHSRHKALPRNLVHVLSISASVTRIKWRPPANETFNHCNSTDQDRHESMLAVATSPLKGASAGGSGVLALWSYNRPFMPLSVVEGHKDGAVTDFEWLDTPLPSTPRNNRNEDASSSRLSRALGDVDSILYGDNNDHADEEDRPTVSIWQHTLSVGRDGRCLIQSFARGDRPISRVPPSCLTLANLSPFQKGYGSLQLFAVCQPVPYGPEADFLLTGLRSDSVTAEGLGVFRELPPEDKPVSIYHEESRLSVDWKAGSRLPVSSPEIVFNVIDQGDLDDYFNPVEGNEEEDIMIVAPEVVHLSRFAKRYQLYPDQKKSTRCSLCLHNASVADSLRSRSLAYMWRMLAFMLKNSGIDGLPDTGLQEPQNVMQFVILTTVKSLLEERADAGDVQTCVALCEIFEMVKSDQTVRILDLEITLIREWYLSYIDLLRDMCLFSDATFLIRSCKDPYIGALNQQSTIIHESCPHCGKALPHADGSSLDRNNTFARRACKSCRRRVGLCFLCHEPVKGVYVWCPGCGHGGHLSHALQWFGGLDGKGVREVCPTGCGHHCNFVKEVSAFPRTEPIHTLALVSDVCVPIGSNQNI